ncbi:MAG: hypothetical protein N2652_03300 [Kiritimatiellae bacterium]|nr:hypothetical protein [Kiritimatiellia bacterium]
MRQEGWRRGERAADPATGPFERVLETAEGSGRPEAERMVIERLRDVDPAVRWWAVVGLRSTGSRAEAVRAQLSRLLRDCAPVRLEAAAALVEGWGVAEALGMLADGVVADDLREALHAARLLQLLGRAAVPAADAMKAALEQAQGRGTWPMYLRFALEPALAALGARPAG